MYIDPVGCEKHINLKLKKFSEILDFDKLELFFPHLMFTLSLSDSKQRRERKCELGAGVWKNLWINTKIMLAKKATFLEVFNMQ